jgi:N-dimethylarginine dimethylaminohydrolase
VPGRLAVAAVEALHARDYRVLFLPEAPAPERNTTLNFVTLGPGRILMAEGYPVFEQFFETAGLACRTTPVTELRKAAGGIGCLTGIVERAPGS